MEFLKQAVSEAAIVDEDEKIQATVKAMLQRIKDEGEVAVREFAQQFDNWQGEFVLSDEKRQALITEVPQSVKDDIDFAHRQIRR